MEVKQSPKLKSAAPQQKLYYQQPICCNYHWIFAVDNSASMTPHLFAVDFLRFLLNYLFFYPVNYWWGLPCNSQRTTMYGFTKQIDPNIPPFYGGYHDDYKPFAMTFNPPPSTDFPSNYGLSIIKAIQTIVKALNL